MNQPIQVMEWQRQYTVWRFLLYGVVAKKKGSWLKKDWASQKKEKGASFKPCDDRLWKMFKTLLDLTWNKIMFPSLIFLFNSTPLHLRAYSQADWKLMCCLFTFSLKKKENLISWNHRKEFWAPDENWTLDLDALLTTELLELYGELCLIQWCPFSDAFWTFL